MSATTADGGQKVPIAFFERVPFTPVLPPMLESTIASSVVGTATRRMPRSQIEAANPARSPTVPPPTAITRPSRSTFCLSRKASTSCSAAIDFERSPAGTTWIDGFTPAGLIAFATLRAHGRTLESVTITADVGSSRRTTPRSSRWTSLPIMTG